MAEVCAIAGHGRKRAAFFRHPGERRDPVSSSLNLPVTTQRAVSLIHTTQIIARKLDPGVRRDDEKGCRENKKAASRRLS
jgi:hypothetical protein